MQFFAINPGVRSPQGEGKEKGNKSHVATVYDMHINRREALFASALASQIPVRAAVEDTAIARLDTGIESILSRQNLDPKSRWYGGIPDGFGLHNGGTIAGLYESFTTAYVHPKSKFHRSPIIVERMKLGQIFLDRHMSADGNINLLITNFNSPPDGAFAVRSASVGARLARLHGAKELDAIIDVFLRRQGNALVKGGIHTPNHRWVMTAALSCLNELYPDDPRYLKRANQWLAEGIDIDSDGQYTERSSGTYNIVVDQSLVTIADKLKRDDLLEPVRKNLASVFKLMDYNDELVTDISTRQDRFTKVDIGRYWYPLAYLALRDSNPVYAYLAKKYAPTNAPLSFLMLEPKLALEGAKTSPPEENYRHVFPLMGVGRIRRGPRSATIFGQKASRFLSVRNGAAMVNAVRLASGFFGKGQFSSSQLREQDGVFLLSQSLAGPYFQPFDSRVVGMDFDRTRKERKQTEIAQLTQSASIRETSKGIELTIDSKGTDEVPLMVEINFREGGRFEGEGLTAVEGSPESRFLTRGYATYIVGNDRLRVGPGKHEHRWIDVRGSEGRLPGPSLLITDYTPFRLVLEFDWS